MRHKNVKNEKKQKYFHKKRKNHLLYLPDCLKSLG